MTKLASPEALQAAYEIVEVLEGAREGAELLEGVRDKLPLVGKDALVSQLREAERVTSALMQMGSDLSPATFCILSSAHWRAEKALRRAKTFA
jgi:hypothetical protein